MVHPTPTPHAPAGSPHKQNRLAATTSPYLLQHADNPVDWYPWGPDALERSRRENKPILLSVGYSACHWCHVMAHESFEDDETAALMNEHFVNVKVDREERPDIDTIYQKVVQLMGQGGGWPLTVFLTPEQEPFYGGTYFPKQPGYGRPSFRQVLLRIDEIWRERAQDVKTQVQAFREGLAQLEQAIDEQTSKAGSSVAIAAPNSLAEAARRLVDRVDEEWGGLGRAPKFPNPTALEIVLRVARGAASAPLVQRCADALRLTLRKMYEGGLYDHLRGGFSRYSVDREWLVPHFEKMLYDNAQLLPLYAEAAVLWPDDRHLLSIVRDTFEYLVSDMRGPNGSFYAATDADSEGEEGKYFVWTPEEVQHVLPDASLAKLFCRVYDVTSRGNFEHGRSILHLPRAIDEWSRELNVELPELEQLLTHARRALLAHRYTRVPPLRDEKILTSWNALLVSGLARAGTAAAELGDTTLTRRCHEAGTAVLARLLTAHVDAEGRVLRAEFNGHVHTRGYLDDVAFLARACLDVHEATLDPSLLTGAHRLAGHALEHYARPHGGFYFSANDGEKLIERSESQHDSALPSGVGVMLEVLLRLDAAGQILQGGRELAEATIQRFYSASHQPFGYASLITAASFASRDAIHVTLRGRTPDDVCGLWNIVVRTRLRTAIPITWSFEPNPGDPRAVVCRAQACSVPLEAEALAAVISR